MVIYSRHRGVSLAKLIRYRALHYVRRYLDDKPSLFFFFMRHRRRYANALVCADTDIVIEGYPRSANTYLVAAIGLASHGALTIASHTHALAQVYLAVQRRLPTVITIRQPLECIISYLARQPEISIPSAIRAYQKFYEGIEEISQHLHVVKFEDVVCNFEKVSQEISDRFSVAIDCLSNSELAQQGIVSVIEKMETIESGGRIRETHVARPSGVRNDSKAYYMSILKRSNYEAELAKCDRIYKRLCGM